MNFRENRGVEALEALLNTDDRCRALHFGLSQLSPAELQKVQLAAQSADGMVLDGFNFDPDRRLWCPLAVGLGVPELCEHEGQGLSNRAAKEVILSVGRSVHGDFSLNPLSGVSGSFFTDHRLRDVRELIEFMIEVETTDGMEAQADRNI